ncbi:hypothetical protein [Micromonospora sp. NPDC005161]
MAGVLATARGIVRHVAAVAAVTHAMVATLRGAVVVVRLRAAAIVVLRAVAAVAHRVVTRVPNGVVLVSTRRPTLLAGPLTGLARSPVMLRVRGTI